MTRDDIVAELTRAAGAAFLDMGAHATAEDVATIASAVLSRASELVVRLHDEEKDERARSLGL